MAEHFESRSQRPALRIAKGGGDKSLLNECRWYQAWIVVNAQTGQNLLMYGPKAMRLRGEEARGGKNQGAVMAG